MFCYSQSPIYLFGDKYVKIWSGLQYTVTQIWSTILPVWKWKCFVIKVFCICCDFRKNIVFILSCNRANSVTKNVRNIVDFYIKINQFLAIFFYVWIQNFFSNLRHYKRRISRKLLHHFKTNPIMILEMVALYKRCKLMNMTRCSKKSPETPDIII